FQQCSLFDNVLSGPFDAAVSRRVLHHTPDPAAFITRQVQLLRPGGILLVADHTTDPDPAVCRHHQDIERARDVTHMRNLTLGELADLLSASGLIELHLCEEAFPLDFDEWFDRGTPAEAKEIVRRKLLAGPKGRSFVPQIQPNGAISILCWHGLARGVKPLTHTHPHQSEARQ
ncbi:MAG: class I SAM-dependent methyltransferase, partial [Candidatus Acidiferrum sp.]